jgi:hypothetical protein
MSLIVGGKTNDYKRCYEFFFNHKLKCLSSLIFPIATTHILTLGDYA